MLENPDEPREVWDFSENEGTKATIQISKQAVHISDHRSLQRKEITNSQGVYRHKKIYIFNSPLPKMLSAENIIIIWGFIYRSQTP